MTAVLGQASSSTTKKRLFGLDLLKVLSMFFIIIHHVSKHGGFFSNADGISKFILEVLNALFMPSVNIFVFVSAYLIINKNKTTIRHLLNLYAQVVFYVLLTYFISCTAGFTDFTLDWFIKCFQPITASVLWFCREYLLFYIVSPLLLKIVYGLNKKEYAITIGVILGILLYTNILSIDILPLASGFSFVWFIVLFLLAGYQYRFGFGAKKYIHTIIFILMSVLTVVVIKKNELVVDYTNFITVLQSLALFNILYDIDISNKYLVKVISYIATCTFGIYLLHDGGFIQPYLYTRVFQTYNYFGNNILLYFFIFVFIILFVGLLVESVRKLILKLIKYVSSICQSRMKRKESHLVEDSIEKYSDTNLDDAVSIVDTKVEDDSAT